MRALAALLLCCFSVALHAAPPTRIEANYDVLTKGIKIAEVREVFIRSGDRYRIESITKPVGLLALFRPDTLQIVSDGSIVAAGLRPINFAYKRSHETKKNAAAYLDWENSSLLISSGSYGRHLETLPPDQQDRLSALYQFRYIPALDERKEVTIPITDGNKTFLRRYLIRTKQMVEVPLGKLETLYLATPAQQTPWKTEIWLSVENGNFPCKIVLTEDDGGVLMQVLTGLSITQ
ncbi:MAG: DUF3108 domain-containing protein [Gammaproteobacteria bacterium]|nr:DUF3108 domain-containing protein [Gammaproteobacteria bacterium]MBU1969053.1 DUF3108 domain-containing protein [Gammaproteobacteria bacterium]